MRYINTLGYIYDMDPITNQLKNIYEVLAGGEDKEKLAFWEGELTQYIRTLIREVGKEDEKLEEEFLFAIKRIVEDAKEHMQTHIRFQTCDGDISDKEHRDAVRRYYGPIVEARNKFAFRSDKDIVIMQAFNSLIGGIDVLLEAKKQGKKPFKMLFYYFNGLDGDEGEI